MSIDPAFAFRGLFAANPALAQLVDGAANRLNNKGGGATATATATAGGGGATATATATAGGAPAQGSVAFHAQRALDAALGQGGLGNLPGGAIGSFTTGLVEGLATGLSSAFAPSSPSPLDCFPPSSGVQPSMLSVDSQGKVVTAGGYSIEATSRHEWFITGPDGNKTRIWGDPHVETIGKDGKIQEKFDFKKDTTFILPDGTKINVKCTPWEGNQNFTVTQTLEIIQGNDKVMITGIDKGKGTVGQVTQGNTGSMDTISTAQTFVAGRNVADWYLDGSQILSNAANGAPDLFKVGDSVLPDMLRAQINGFKDAPISEAAWWTATANPMSSAELTQILQKHGQLAKSGQMNNVLNQVLALLPKLIQVLQSLLALRSHNPYNPQPAPKPTAPPQPTPPVYDPNQHAKGIKDAFHSLGAMFIALGQMMQLAASVKPSALPVQGR